MPESTVLNVAGLRLVRGGRELVDGASFAVQAAERLGLVGPNGSGKSTLLACLAGRLEPTEGVVRKAPGIRVAWLPQEGGLPGSGTVAERIAATLAPIHALEAEMRAQERRLATGEGSLDRYGDVAERFEHVGGYRAEADIGEALSRFGLGGSIVERSVSELSGGERRRVALALALSAGADLLLLDEPTTHLDLRGRAYLEARLAAFRGAALVATHDRHLLDASCTGLLAVGDGTARRTRVVPGLGREAILTSTGRERVRTAEPAVSARHLTARVGERTLFADVAVRVERGERVALVGPNGSGKSTLLALLAAERASDDPRASRRYAAGVRLFYADQRSRGLVGRTAPATQLERWVSAPRARQLLGLARVPREAWTRPPETLSGGERARAGLALTIATEADLLMLDEPEAHLDLQGIAMLERSVVDADATVVFASHDRTLIERIATRILAVEEGQVREVRGGIAAYLSGRDRDAPPPALGSRKGAARAAPASRAPAPPAREHEAGLPGPSRAGPGAGHDETGRTDPTDALDALESERATLEDALLDPTALPERERRRVERRLREVLDELSERYDTRYPPPEPRVAVRELGVRFGAVPAGDHLEVLGPGETRAYVHRRGRVAHVSTVASDGTELLPWAREALVRAGSRLAFYLLDVDTVQVWSRRELESAGFTPAGGGWWLRERDEFESAEGWGAGAGRTERTP